MQNLPGFEINDKFLRGSQVTHEDEKEEDGSSRDIAGWLSGRRSDFERWVEETCQKAVIRTRGVLAEEIRGLSKRVEQMHDLLDQLERYVESQQEIQEEDGKNTEE